MIPLNIPVLITVLSLLSPPLVLAYLGQSHHHSGQQTKAINPEGYEINIIPPPSAIQSQFSQLSPLTNNCGPLEGGCFGQEDVKDLEEPVNYEEEEQPKSWRIKRYPEHLDPNQLPFYPFWLRVGECPLSSDGARQHYCPTPTPTGKWVCIDDYQLCDGMKNCPNAEDESGHYCLFYKALKTEVELLTRTISSLGSTSSNPLEEAHQNPEMMRPKTSRLSWTVA